MNTALLKRRTARWMKNRARHLMTSIYLTADEEDEYIVAQANEPGWTRKRHGSSTTAFVARKRDQIIEVSRANVDYMDVSPKQLVSVATAHDPLP